MSSTVLVIVSVCMLRILLLASRFTIYSFNNTFDIITEKALQIDRVEGGSKYNYILYENGTVFLLIKPLAGLLTKHPILFDNGCL